MDAAKPRMVGINHVAIEVGDIDAALAFYGAIFQYTLRGRGEHNAFIDLGDQFIALMQGPASGKLEQRHFGIVRARAEAAGATVLDGRFLDFLDPWGNRIEVVEYANVQFSKAPHVLRGMGLALSKNDNARGELAEKGMAEG
jgi:catechol 2,3-dioxygenase-like lactoylglutathione lyase family enzyme